MNPQDLTEPRPRSDREPLARVGEVTVELEIDAPEALAEPEVEPAESLLVEEAPVVDLLDFPAPTALPDLPAQAFELAAPTSRRAATPLTAPHPGTTAHHANTIERRLGQGAA